MQHDEIAYEALRRRLGSLPSFAPPASLWPRIVAARRASASRTPRYAAAAAIATIAIAGAYILARPRPGGEAQLAAHLANAAALEAELAAARGAGVANPDLWSLERELARVEVALQSAYDGRAAPGEIETLWRARTERLEALLVAYRHAATLVRI